MPDHIPITSGPLRAMLATAAQLGYMEDAIAFGKQCASSGDAMVILRSGRDFHRAVGMAADNQPLMQFVVNNEERTDLYLLSYVSILDTTRMGRSNQEHEAIFQAIKQRDPETAARLVAYHSQSVRDRFSAFFNEEEFQNIFPLLDKWIETEAEQYWAKNKGGSLNPKQVDLYKRFGAFPIGDTSTVGGGSWGWWYHIDEATEQRWQEDPEQWWHHYFEHTEQSVARIKRIGEDTQTKVTEHYPPHLSHESIIPLVESLACDVPRVMIVNVQNKGGCVPVCRKSPLL